MIIESPGRRNRVRPIVALIAPAEPIAEPPLRHCDSVSGRLG
jgi:hypothetical protein